MSYSYNEILELWGRKLLRDWGYKITDDEKIEVELTTEESGGCETCWFSEPVIKVKFRKGERTVNDYSFHEVMLELIATTAEYTGKAH